VEPPPHPTCSPWRQVRRPSDFLEPVLYLLVPMQSNFDCPCRRWAAWDGGVPAGNLIRVRLGDGSRAHCLPRLDPFPLLIPRNRRSSEVGDGHLPGGHRFTNDLSPSVPLSSRGSRDPRTRNRNEGSNHGKAVSRQPAEKRSSDLFPPRRTNYGSRRRRSSPRGVGTVPSHHVPKHFWHSASV
jgi:hypothetical protein